MLFTPSHESEELKSVSSVLPFKFLFFAFVDLADFLGETQFFLFYAFDVFLDANIKNNFGLTPKIVNNQLR
jgi:hypothetical protein